MIVNYILYPFLFHHMDCGKEFPGFSLNALKRKLNALKRKRQWAGGGGGGGGEEGEAARKQSPLEHPERATALPSLILI